MKKANKTAKKKPSFSMNTQERILMTQVILGLALKGLSFSQACRTLGVNRGNARMAITGRRNHSKAQEVKEKIFEIANIEAIQIKTGEPLCHPDN